MGDSNDFRPPKSKTTSAAPDVPHVDPSPSDATDPATLMQHTLSESGEEASQTSLSKAGSIAAGSRIGPYHLVRKLGQGGMGAVYEARHTKLDKTFALKVLPPTFASNETLMSRFEREMKAVGKLDHPNIIRATNADEWNGTHYLVMEFVEGTDLSHHVREHGPLSVAEACDVIRQAALGLAHAHEHGLVHRDVKPSNLFVVVAAFARTRADSRIHQNAGHEANANPRVLANAATGISIKLLDLGLARMDHDEASGGGLTSSGQVLGTPDYMAPEQWDDTHGVDARADLYGLGGTLFFALTGRAPYFDEGSKPSLMRLMKLHIEGPIPDLTARRSDVPPELDAIYRRLMAKKPEDRFQSSTEVALALEAFLRSHVRQNVGADTLNADPHVLANVATSDATKVAITAPRDEPRASDSQSTIERNVGWDSIPTVPLPTTGRDGIPTYESRATEALTLPNVAPQGSSRGAMTATWKRTLLVGGVLACVVVVAVFKQVGRVTGTNDPVLSANRETSASGPSGSDDKVQGKSPAGSPGTEKATGWGGWPVDAPKPAIAPFDAEQAKKHQDEWAAYLKVPVEYQNSIGMKFRLIPPGEFLMGMTKQQAEAISAQMSVDVEHWTKMSLSSTPDNRVRLTRPFYLGVFEATQEQHENVLGSNPSEFSENGAGKDRVAGNPTHRHPVEMISFIDAAAFCVALSKRENLDPAYFTSNGAIAPNNVAGYRLPTEAEWECACRAGSTTAWSQGEELFSVGTAAWFDANSGATTHPVGQLKCNPYGLYDMHGNVWEWCQDWHDLHAYTQRRAGVTNDPRGPDTGTARVLRGGSFADPASLCRSAMRPGLDPALRSSNFGFRLLISVDSVRQALKLTGPALPKSA